MDTLVHTGSVDLGEQESRRGELLHYTITVWSWLVKRVDVGPSYRFGRAASLFCSECGEVKESPEHVVFRFPRFEQLRNGMPALNVENIFDKMCREEDTWNVVSSVVR
jgi:hypothetical protein